jgi:hypothetical protein
MLMHTAFFKVLTANGPSGRTPLPFHFSSIEPNTGEALPLA